MSNDLIPDEPCGTDKFEHGYLPFYNRICSEFPGDASILELGVLEGASLAMWKRAFPAGRVMGVDSNPDTVCPPGCLLFICSQDEFHLDDQFDLIVDDASHHPGPTERSLNKLWDNVKPGGWYVIEDWLCEAWFPHEPDYQGMLDLALSLAERTAWEGPHRVDELVYFKGLVGLRKPGGAA